MQTIQGRNRRVVDVSQLARRCPNPSYWIEALLHQDLYLKEAAAGRGGGLRDILIFVIVVVAARSCTNAVGGGATSNGH